MPGSGTTVILHSSETTSLYHLDHNITFYYIFACLLLGTFCFYLEVVKCGGSNLRTIPPFIIIWCMNIPLISKVECPQRKGKVSYGAIILFKREPGLSNLIGSLFYLYLLHTLWPRRPLVIAEGGCLPLTPPPLHSHSLFPLFSILSHPAFLLPPPYSSPPQSVTLSCPVFFSHHPTIILNHLFSTFSWLHLDTIHIQTGLHCIYISWFCDGAAVMMIVMQMCSWELKWW